MNNSRARCGVPFQSTTRRRIITKKKGDKQDEAQETEIHPLNCNPSFTSSQSHITVSNNEPDTLLLPCRHRLPNHPQHSNTITTDSRTRLMSMLENSKNGAKKIDDKPASSSPFRHAQTKSTGTTPEKIRPVTIHYPVNLQLDQNQTRYHYKHPVNHSSYETTSSRAQELALLAEIIRPLNETRELLR